MTEIWNKAAGYEEYYEVSTEGRIRTLDRLTVGMRQGVRSPQIKRGKLLSPHLQHGGYLNVKLKIGASRKNILVHRLVAATFLPDSYQPDLTVNHKNGVKTDNRVENLEWITRAENTKHEWETGLVDLRGENQPSHILIEAEILQIRSELALGASTRALASKYGVSDALIYKIKNRERWAHLD